MVKVLVVGGFAEGLAGEAPIRQFVRALAGEVVRQGHVLLGGCQTELDRELAEAAAAIAPTAGKLIDDCLISYVGRNNQPAHGLGSVRQSQLPRWDLLGPRLVYPEPVAQADAVILIGGWDGTHRAANWSRIAGKPLLPVAAFGQAAAEIYAGELEEFRSRYGARIRKDEYEVLNTVIRTGDNGQIATLAQRIVSLTERILTPRQVFVIMSFAKDDDLEDAYETFKRTCEEFKFDAFKIDEHVDESKRILPEIIETIRQAAFIIADISDPRPNVYYELGYAQALGKSVIVTAKEGTQLPFDVHDVPTILWRNQKSLRDALRAKIAKIAARSGR